MIPKPGPSHSSLRTWGEGGQLLATFHSHTVGGLCGKALSPAAPGRWQQQEASVPSHQPSTGKPYPEVRREEVGEEMPISPSKPHPPAASSPVREGGRSTLGPPPGAEGRANRGSAFGNDSRFPVWFLSRGLWDMLTCIMCVHMHIMFLFSQGFFFFLFATFFL